MKKWLSYVLLFFVLLVPSMPVSASPVESTANMREAGTYPVVVSYKDKVTGEEKEVIVYVTVITPRTTIDEGVNEGIDASDVLVPAGTMADITDAAIITLTNAHAWNLADGSPIAIAKVELIAVDEKEGIYQVKFSTEKGTTTTVTILESLESYFVLDEEYINSIGLYGIISRWIWGFIISIILLLAIIVILYIYTRKRVKRIEETLYERKLKMRGK